MRGFVDDIEELTEGNTDFRRVLYTARNMQLVLMALQPGEEIGEEVHDDGDQFFRVEDGEGEILIDGNVSRIRADMAMIVPAGARHNVKNTGNEPLKLYTIYSPP
ncbi:cupin domain-containing protein, partial [Ochrobactrum sp. SFR4]